MTRILLIDDLRELSREGTTARTYGEGIAALQSAPYDILYLDHDLGDPDPAKTGYGILCWLERNRQFLPGEIRIITANASGRERMRLVVEGLYRQDAAKGQGRVPECLITTSPGSPDTRKSATTEKDISCPFRSK